MSAGQQLVETKKGFPQLDTCQNQTPAGMRGMGEGGWGQLVDCCQAKEQQIE